MSEARVETLYGMRCQYLTLHVAATSGKGYTGHVGTCLLYLDTATK